MKNAETFAQQVISNRIDRKIGMMKFATAYGDYGDSLYDDYSDWTEYNESYSDYNDCHGDYYDAEAEN